MDVDVDKTGQYSLHRGMSERAAIRKEVAKAIVAAGENGRSIEARQPERAARLLELMAEGKSWKSIVRDEGVDWYTLVGLRARHKGLIEKRKEIVAQDAMELIEGARMLQQEKMKMLAEDEGALKRVNIRDLAMSYGIYADKFFMATEGNKVTVEHRSGAPSLEDAMKAIEEAKAKLKAGSIEVVAKPVEEV
jgi:hypothetical protein